MLSFQAKWAPVHVKKTRQIKNLEPVSILIETGWVMDPMIVTENLVVRHASGIYRGSWQKPPIVP
jgi:hypothetical protein